MDGKPEYEEIYGYTVGKHRQYWLVEFKDLEKDGPLYQILFRNRDRALEFASKNGFFNKSKDIDDILEKRLWRT